MLNRNLTLKEYIICNEDNLDAQCIEYLEELVELREEVKVLSKEFSELTSKLESYEG